MFRRLWERWRERRRLRREVSQLFSSSTARAVANRMMAHQSAAPAKESSIERDVDFIFLSVHSDEATEVDKRVQVILKIAEAHDALVDALYPVTTLVFGALEPRTDGKLQPLVAALRQAAPWCSMVHGSTRAMVGTIGGPSRCAWTFWWPEKGAAIACLWELASGEIADWPKDAAAPTS